MEDDDEFGDLYTDVLRPLAGSFQSHHQVSDSPAVGSNSAPLQSRGIDLNYNSDDEDIVYGPPDSNNLKSNLRSTVNLKLNATIQDNTAAELGTRPEIRELDLNLDSNQEVSRIQGLAGNGGSKGLEFKARALPKGDGVSLPEKSSGGFHFTEEDNDINIIVEEMDNKDGDLVEKDNGLADMKQTLYNSADGEENTGNYEVKNMVTEIVLGQMIPGLSDRLENEGTSNLENEWESEESEDDLQIVLNDNPHGPIGIERMPGMHDEDDEDGDPLVIVADNGDAGFHHHHQQMMMEEQEWTGEEGVSGTDGEKKELGDASKTSGPGGTATPSALQPRVGYSNHLYHHQYHSQFKYVRPGAAPLPGVAPGGIPSQVRPPVTIGTVVGRGRGDWRPTGTKGVVPMQKGFHPNYGTPVWGTTVSGRGYGSGLDFTLPSHKTIFEVDIDSFEEKPWKLPGIDVSDFFNFGLNEESWKDYCKQLEQLRLETTMQSKIRVYESGRSEQDYDPDLPPELAAAVGIQDIPSANANPGNADACPTDFARECARERPPLPIGRPIPVETGSGDRLPSIDTRRLRLHDSDAIIEIVCHSSTDDDDMAEQQDDDQAADDLREGGEVDDLRGETVGHINGSMQAYNLQKRELVARRAQFENSNSSNEIVRVDVLQFPSEVPAPDHSDRDIMGPYEGSSFNDNRSAEGREHARSPTMTASDFAEKEVSDDHAEESFDSQDGKRSSSFYSQAVGSDVEPGVEAREDINDEAVIDDKIFDEEADAMALNASFRDTPEDGNLICSTQKRNLITVEGQLSQENTDGKDSKAMRSRENSKARSGSSKDHRKFRDSVEDEVIQEKRHPCSETIKRSVGDYNNPRRKVPHEKDEPGRHHAVVRGKEDFYSRRAGDPDSSLCWHVKSESSHWRKESDISEVSWHRKDEDLPGKRIRIEEASKREHGGETGSRSRGKARESERTEKDDHRQSRNHLDNGSWRGAYQDQDIGFRPRDRDGSLRSRIDKVDDSHGKRRKEETYISRGLEDISYDHRESSDRRKRERDDISDQQKRDDRARLKDGDLHNVRQKEEESLQRERSERQRERDEWHRPRLSHEEILSKREREETRSVMRSGHGAEDKTWISHSRVKDDYKGSSRDYQLKDVGKHSDQLKRRDRSENESSSQHRGQENAYARGNHFSNDEKRARSERPSTRDERVAFASDSSTVHEHKLKENSRKNKESESGDHRSSFAFKRTQGEHSGQMSKTVNMRTRAEQGTDKNDIHLHRQPSRKQGEEASSDEEQPDSRKGRSKFERWTSHKERDINVSSMSSSLNSKDLDTNDSGKAALAGKLPEEPSKKIDDKLHTPINDKATEAEVNDSKKGNATEDKHLDTVEKLKKRSERFKLPMPIEKDATTIKKNENEPLPYSSQTENPLDSEIKSERPARKRRWTGN
ncbi:FIP1[V]-like protein isoform X1 [Primulina huaijiensis]|uniref:FIP1[V]-like protein isoform X1 n=1 Tax=Primulina huaijiensis TaxID=1492673 RepID=UPI003CC6F7BE